MGDAITEAPVQIENLDFFFGAGELRKQILFDVSTEIRAAEIVIVMGPSGSGKTTLLTLIGALRSTQSGRMRVLGEELTGARASVLTRVRKNIGYIFQAHNLLASLTASQNVQMSACLQPDYGVREVRSRALEMLEAVGLAGFGDRLPRDLSGGQRQRVAIARALVGRPRLVLADEPTASLDRESGREVIQIMHDLAKRQGVTVLLVTHDNRILDVADRIVHLEDGRLSSFTSAVMTNTRNMMDLLARNNRRGDLARHVEGLSVQRFADLVAEATAECQEFLRVVEIANDGAFQSMLDQILDAFTLKIGEILDADRASLFLVDEARGELVSKIAKSDGEKPLEIVIPLGAGIAGRVAATGESMNIPDAYAEPLFNRAVDQKTGYHTRSILCMPLRDSKGQTAAVAQLLNKRGGGAFLERDEERLREFSSSLGVVLESWSQMSRRRRAG